jgi:hypothetical protein
MCMKLSHRKFYVYYQIPYLRNNRKGKVTSVWIVFTNNGAIYGILLPLTVEYPSSAMMNL